MRRHILATIDMSVMALLIAGALGVSSSCTGASKRAAAAGLYSLGTGAAVAAQACASQSVQACRETGVVAGFAVAGMALASWATAYLSETSEPAPPPAPSPSSLATK